MATNYGYHYANVSESDGLCLGTLDTSDYILDRTYVPVDDAYGDWLLKYYWPLPETVTSFDDFQGLWYLDAAHTQLFEEGNA